LIDVVDVKICTNSLSFSPILNYKLQTKKMFKLKLPTDPRWVNIVEKNISEILTDHAWCEQKALSNSISLIVHYSDKSEMVTALMLIADEELQHFKQVHEKILARGFVLGPERKDEYVNLIYNFRRKGGSKNQRLIDHLLFSAMIEARSCERFRVLSENISDPDLKIFYNDLMISEANHYTTFIGFARQYAEGEDVEKRWQQFLDYEGEVISKFGVKETIHG
jgi:tRNA 2-(methylsulfanyl)-N6-isopentenyladenosine37 hydroxylase